VLTGRSDPEHRTRVAAWLHRVRLDAGYLDRLPEELSGGEKQRLAIARAFLENPSLVLCDEPLSALDVSVQASIVQLLLELQTVTGSSYLLISHDLAVVRYVADVIAVMYFGWIVETGPAVSYSTVPVHPYTEALLSARTSVEFEERGEVIRLEGSVPDPADPPQGCVFHTRCARRIAGLCDVVLPPWRDAAPGRRYRCHIPPEELAEQQDPERRGGG
jgi:peptide/nickel transport system ATP-binding protein